MPVKKPTKTRADYQPSAQKSNLPLAIFAHGTGDKQTMKSGNIIGTFAAACNTPKLILDGPNILGGGVEENVITSGETIKQWLETAIANEQGFYEVNMTGLSRGASTCFRIANHIKALANNPKIDPAVREKLAKVRFNIFVIDPVPGLGNKADEGAVRIPDNVANLQIIYQKDEMRRDFKPSDLSRLDIQDHAKTKFQSFVLPGNHTDATKVKKTKKHSLSSAANIATQLLNNFLQKHGTTFTAPPQLPGLSNPSVAEDARDKALQLFQNYVRLREDAAAYKKRARKFKFHDSLTPRTERTFNKYLDDYVADSDIFINQEERELFRVLYPDLFNQYFEHGIVDAPLEDGAKADKKGRAAQQLDQLKNQNLLLWQQLIKHGYTNLNGSYSPTTVRGAYRRETCPYLREHYGKENELASLLPDEPSKDEQALSLLQKQMTQFIHRGMRFKDQSKFISELMAFLDAPHKGDALATRQKMYDILAANRSDAEKKQQLLNILKEHYVHLVQSGEDSPYTQSLAKLLQQHGIVYKPIAALTNTAIPNTVLYRTGQIIAASATPFKYLSYLLATVCGLVFLPLEELGRRGMRDSGVPIVKQLGIVVQYLGWALKNALGITWLLNKVVQGIQEVAHARIEKSGAFTVAETSPSLSSGAKILNKMPPAAPANADAPVNNPPQVQPPNEDILNNTSLPLAVKLAQAISETAQPKPTVNNGQYSNAAAVPTDIGTEPKPTHSDEPHEPPKDKNGISPIEEAPVPTNNVDSTLTPPDTTVATNVSPSPSGLFKPGFMQPKTVANPSSANARKIDEVEHKPSPLVPK